MTAPLPSAVLEPMTVRDVERAIQHETLDDRDVMALLSPAAEPYLETLAQRAQSLTRQRFGRTMQLYAPLYVSNECVNRCTYCGFAHDLSIVRRTLTVDEVLAESRHLQAEGFRHLLLVSGEAPRVVTVEYLEAIAQALSREFDSLSLEVQSFGQADYERLVRAGYDGLTLYQETYDPDVYSRVHLKGPKSRYSRRLEAMHAAGRAGFRSLGIGALLGLAPWRLEAFAVLRHGIELSRAYWKSRLAVSFPRLRAHAGGSLPAYPVSDRALVQMLCVARLTLPDAELVLSTRESAFLRDKLIHLGVTRMSAGSRTNPGGYGNREAAGGQFEIEDARSAQVIAQMLEAQGLEAVWKDFDRGFLSDAALSPVAS